jgi:uncharacterized protein (UPF0335 family)
MRKTLFLFIVLLGGNGLAQTAAQDHEIAVAKEAAVEMCECMNSFFNELHPKLLTLVMESVEVGEEKAEDNLINYMQTVSDDELKRISEDIERMENTEVILGERCGAVYKKYENFESDVFMNAMIDALSDKPDCKLIWVVLKNLD